MKGKYVMANFCRGFYIRLVFLFSIGCLSVQAAEETLTIPGSSLTYEILNGVFYIRSAQLERRQDGTYSHAYFIRTVNNVQSGADIISVDGFGITPGQSKTFTSPGSHTMTSGYYYRVALRRIGGGFTWEQQSTDFQFNGANYVRIAGTNDKPYRIRIALIGNVTGDIVHAVEVAAGQAYDETFELSPPDTTVTPHVFIQAAFQDGIWTELPEGEFGDDPAKVGEPIEAVNDTTPDPASIDGEGLPSGKPSSTGSGQVVWSNSGSTTQETALDKATFKEGINKLLENGGAGGGADMTQTNAKLDSIKANTATSATAAQGTNNRLDDIKGTLQQIKTIEEARDTQVEEAMEENPTESEMSAAGQAAGTALQSTLPDPGSAPTMSSKTLSKETPDFTVSLPAILGGITIDFNPFTGDRFGPVIAWFRAAVGWLTVVLFGLWVSMQLKDFMLGIGNVNQAKGNPIVGGTGAQATALIAAALITAAVLAFAVAIVGYLGDELGFTSIVSAVHANPMSTMPGKAAWMLDQVFPVTLMLTALVAKVSWSLYGVRLWALLVSVVRFIVP